jgi:hypothetical protein
MSQVLQSRTHAVRHLAASYKPQDKLTSEITPSHYALVARRWTPLALAPLALILFFVFAAFPAQGATCPVFSEPGWGPTCTWQNNYGVAPAEVKVTFGKCPLIPTTATLVYPAGRYLGTAEIFALYYNGATCTPIPMPDWISFTPVSGPVYSTPAGTVQMTIDPTKGGGTIILEWSFNGRSQSALIGEMYDQNGANFATFNDDGTRECGFGTFYVITDTPPVSPGSTGTGLDLGPNFPRSGCEGQCGSPINLTNGNTWLQADDYELPGLEPIAPRKGEDGSRVTVALTAGERRRGTVRSHRPRNNASAGSSVLRLWPHGIGRCVTAGSRVRLAGVKTQHRPVLRLDSW